MARRAWIIGLTTGLAPFVFLFLLVIGALVAESLEPRNAAATGWSPFLARLAFEALLVPLAWRLAQFGRPVHPLWTTLIVVASAGIGALWLARHKHFAPIELKMLATWLGVLAVGLALAALLGRRGWTVAGAAVGVVGGLVAAVVATIARFAPAGPGTDPSDGITHTTPPYWLLEAITGRNYGADQGAWILADAMDYYAYFFVGFLFFAVPFVLSLARRPNAEPAPVEVPDVPSLVGGENTSV